MSEMRKLIEEAFNIAWDVTTNGKWGPLSNEGLQECWNHFELNEGTPIETLERWLDLGQRFERGDFW